MNAACLEDPDVPAAPVTAPRRPRRRLRALAAAVALSTVACGLAAAGLAPATVATTRGPGTGGAPAPATIAWGACPAAVPGDTTRDPRQERDTLRIPLDYRAPRGRMIEIAVSRIAAAPKRRSGVLLLNGGGPGPSLDVPSILAHYLPAAVAARYDLVGFDPCGVAHSTPMSCGHDADELVRLFTFQCSYSDATMMATDDAPVPPLAQVWRAAVDFAGGAATGGARPIGGDLGGPALCTRAPAGPEIRVRGDLRVHYATR